MGSVLRIYDPVGQRYVSIPALRGPAGDGDMNKDTYDANANGIVDNAEKVNNHTVEADVPAGAQIPGGLILKAVTLESVEPLS